MSDQAPSRPNLEYLKKQAKALLKAHKQSNPEVIPRIKEHHPRLLGFSDSDILGGEFSLQDAQLVIAREYGFSSWPHLVAAIAASNNTRTGEGLLTKDQVWAVQDRHEDLARLLGSSFSEIMQKDVDVDIAFVDQATYAQCIQSLSDPSCACWFAMQTANRKAILDIAWPVVFALLDPSSKEGRKIEEGDRSPLNPREIEGINRIVQRLLGDLQSVWVSSGMTGAELEFSPSSLRIASLDETCVIICFEVTPDEKREEVEGRRERRVITQEEIDSFLDAPSKGPGHGVVTLIYPVSTIESVLSFLSQPA